MGGDPAETIAVGRVVRAHGIRGELLLRGDPEGIELIGQCDHVYTGSAGAE